jgi:hypothetical protein
MSKKYIIFFSLLLLVALVSGCVRKPGTIQPDNQAFVNKETRQATTTNATATSSISNLAMTTDGIIDTSDWQTYRNEKYEFEISYPSKWFIIEGDDEFTGEKFLTFSNLENRCNKENCPSDYLAVFVSIYSNSSKTYDNFIEQKSKYEKIATTKENIAIEDNNKNYIELCIISKMNEKQNETWDMVKPEAKAFYQDSNYSYIFYIATEIQSGPRGQQKEIEILKKMLGTYKINKLIDTSDWQTYRNDKYGFELKFQSIWGKSASDIGINDENKHFLLDFVAFNNYGSKSSLGIYPLFTIALIDKEKDNRPIIKDGIAIEANYGALEEKKKITNINTTIYQNQSDSGFSKTAIMELNSVYELVITVSHLESENECERLLNGIIFSVRLIK